MAWCGAVRFGWCRWWRPSPALVPPVPLRGPSWEGSLFRAARRTNEWMSGSGGGPLQWRLFVYTSRSRHTSLAAQPSDNLWCSNRPWVCGCPSAQSLCGSGWRGFRDSRHIPTSSARLRPEPLVIYRYMCAHTNTYTPSLGEGWRVNRLFHRAPGGTGRLDDISGVVSFASKRCERPAATNTVVSQCCPRLTTD